MAELAKITHLDLQVFRNLTLHVEVEILNIRSAQSWIRIENLLQPDKGWVLQIQSKRDGRLPKQRICETLRLIDGKGVTERLAGVLDDIGVHSLVENAVCAAH